MQFKAPANIRPTSAKVCEAIFNILRSEIGTLQGLACLDLFAGSGTLGLTALKLGAANLVAVDSSYESIKFLKENAERMKLSERVRTLKADALKFNFDELAPFNLIFADPPYKIPDKEVKSLLMLIPKLLSEDGVFILELSSSNQISAEQAGLTFLSKRVYGGTGLWIWRKLV